MKTPAAIPIARTSRRTYCCGVRAEDLDEKFPVVNIDSDALDAVRLLAEHRLNGLVVVTDTSETPYAVLPASQVVRFIVPGYATDDPRLARFLTESMADHAAEKLSGKTIRDAPPKRRQHIPVAEADDTIIEVAEVMARLRSPLVSHRQRRQVARGDHRITAIGRSTETLIGLSDRAETAHRLWQFTVRYPQPKPVAMQPDHTET